MELDLEDLTGQLLDHAEEGCRAVLEGKAEKYENSLLSLFHYFEVMDRLGMEHMDGEGDTNGWQHDYWEYFEVNGKRYRLSGSGHYGDSKFEAD